MDLLDHNPAGMLGRLCRVLVEVCTDLVGTLVGRERIRSVGRIGGRRARLMEG